MSFSRVSKESGSTWADGEVLTSDQMNELETNVVRAVDGEDGGSYSPSDAIKFEGTGADGYSVYIEDGHFEDIQIVDGGSLTFKGDDDDNLPILQEADSTDARSYNYVQNLALGINAPNSLTAWKFTLFAPFPPPDVYWQQTSTSADFQLFLPIVNMPARAVITSVTIHLSGGTGVPDHTSGIPDPSDMPTATLFATTVPGTGGGTTEIGTVSDPSTTISGYDSLHSMSITGLSLDYEPGRSYYLEITGEEGANAVDDALRIHRVSVACDVDKIGP